MPQYARLVIIALSRRVGVVFAAALTAAVAKTMPKGFYGERLSALGKMLQFASGGLPPQRG